MNMNVILEFLVSGSSFENMETVQSKVSICVKIYHHCIIVYLYLQAKKSRRRDYLPHFTVNYMLN